MYSVALCDDDKIFAAAFERQLSECLAPESYSLRIFYSGGAMRLAVGEGYRPDIVFLDVKLEDASGIEEAVRLFPYSSGVQVIFVTGYVEYCTEVYQSEHVYFLLKPIQSAQLKNAVEKALDGLSRFAENTIAVRNGGRILRLRSDNILYVESDKRKLIIHSDDEDIEIYSTMNAFVHCLPEGFVLCHKSFVANMARVREMDGDCFILDNDVTVPVSQKKKAEARKKFLDYIGGTV